MCFLVLALFGVVVMTACGGNPTEAGSSGSAATTAEATTTTSGVADEQLAAAAAIGDIAAGEALFNEPLEGIPHSVSCSTCHSLDPTSIYWSPTLAGISAVAADRVDGMSDVEYLKQSIVDPFAFRVDGAWAFPMPPRYSDALSEDQIENLIAFMLTR